MSAELHEALIECRRTLAAAQETFARLFAGIQEFGRPEWEVVRQANLEALKKADAALSRHARLVFESDDPLVIKNWLADGELHEPLPTNVQELYEAAGELLDSVSSHDILGEIVFDGVDGRRYVLTVEAVLGEANPELYGDPSP